VYLFTSSLGVSWSSSAVRQSFIPLLHRLVNAAISGRGFPRNIVPGAIFVAAWPDGGSAELTTPDGQVELVQTTVGPQGRFVVVEPTSSRGLYELRRNGTRIEAFTVLGQFAEPDFRTLTGIQQERLANWLGHRIYQDWPSAVKDLGPLDLSPELWPAILLAIGALYMFETWFVRFL